MFEDAGEGVDTIRTGLGSYARTALNIENLVRLGGPAGRQQLRGNSLDNSLSTVSTFNTFFDLRDGVKDTVNGGYGDDTIYFGAAYTLADFVDGGTRPHFQQRDSDSVVLQGNYDLSFSSSNLIGVERLVLLSSQDTTYGGGSGSPSLLFSYSIVYSGVASGEVDASSLIAGETLTFDGSAVRSAQYYVTGGAGNDRLLGVTSASGGGGNDVIVGTENLFGDDGDDYLEGFGSARLYGGKGRDYMVGVSDPIGLSSNRMEGGEDGDIMFGGVGEDTLRGDAGDDPPNSVS